MRLPGSAGIEGIRMSNNSGKIAALIAVLALLLVSASLSAADGLDRESPDLNLEPAAMTRTPSRRELSEERAALRASVLYKLRNAKLLLKNKRWQECISICDEILTLDPGNSLARQYKRECSTLRMDDNTAKLDTERKMRDNALLEEVTREGLPVGFGPDQPRPNITDKDMPFAESLENKKAQSELLEQVIPEINLIDADLNYVLQLLFKTTGVNIVYKPEDVQGNITIHARNMTLEDVLKYLSRNLDIGYTVDKKTVWLYSASNDKAARGLMRPTVIPLKVGLTSAGGGGEEEDATSDIEEMLTWMEENWPGWPAESKWMLDRKLNRIIITSTPDIIDEVRKMVDMLDVAPIQVLIVARFVEVRENTLDQLGFNWNLAPNPAILPENVDGTLTSDAWRDNKTRMGATAANVGVGADAFTSGAMSILNDHQLSFTMQALQSNTGTKVLTAPRVIALNNKKANIKITDKLIYVSDVQQETVTSTNDTNSYSTTVNVPQYSTKDVGFELDVFPSVGSDMKTITLQVVPLIQEKTGTTPFTVSVVNPDGTIGKVEYDGEPVIKEQTINVQAAVEDGSTLVVGGIFRDNYNEGGKQIPWLSKLPVVGKAFKSKDHSRERTCLLIFVTAKIITPQNSVYTNNTAQAVRENAVKSTIEGADIDGGVINDLLGDPR
jgi:type II secretory pathway component GspD/PulD (secretin)